MKEITIEEYDRIKEKAVNFFRSHRIIKSLCLGDIKIDPNGFNHIEWKNKNHKRPLQESYIRYLCFLDIAHVLEGLKLYQEYKEEMIEVTVKKHGKIVKEKKIVQYYGFVGICNRNTTRIKVIVKKVDSWNRYEFVSVIPAWNLEGYKDIKIKNLFYEHE